MAKVDLKKYAGFSLYLEGTQLTTQDMRFDDMGLVEIDQIRPQLLNEELNTPEIFYYKYLGLDHDGIFRSKQLKINIYLLPANFAGVEFVKTRATRLPNHPKIMEVIYGQGAVLMQNLSLAQSETSRFDNSTSRTQDIIFSRLRKGSKFIVPGGYDISLINTKNSAFIVQETYFSETKHVSRLDAMKGMSYYIIRKNAKQEIVQNPVYRDVEKFRRIKWDEVVTQYGITLKTPIIKQILRKYDKFTWLFQENSIVI